jgi:protein-S-isoprenylcysteine O-methyltransferase Ste14
MMYINIPVTWPRLPELPDQPIFNILSRILLYTGLGVVIIAIVRLGIGPTFGQDKNTLRTSGIYAFSRNPQVLGYTLILLALFLCYPSWYAAGWMLLFLVMISLMVHTEEEFLLKRYGAEYRIYCRKAPRYLLI